MLLGLKNREKPIRRIHFTSTFLGNKTLVHLIDLAAESLIHSELKFDGDSAFTRSRSSLFSQLGKNSSSRVTRTPYMAKIATAMRDHMSASNSTRVGTTFLLRSHRLLFRNCKQLGRGETREVSMALTMTTMTVIRASQSRRMTLWTWSRWTRRLCRLLS